METVELNFKEYGSGEPLIILHGFMGSLDNWHTLATKFGSNRHVFTIDQRNHGKSTHSLHHSIPLMVEDLRAFLEKKNLSNCSIIGHSMGGKVAMKFALEYPQIVQNLIIVDIAPRQYKRGHDDVFEAIFSVDFSKVESRKQAEEMMEPYISDFGTRQFLLKNLDRKEDGTYGWKMNVPVLHRDYEEIVKPIESDFPFLGNTLVIKGGNSRYINSQDETDFEQLFPACQFVSIPNAGHWVHAEAPEEFYKIVLDFIS
ncbi:MAG: alpha/beta hydrolase [Bacteroidetes bacterium B1(2017)]|nr:MAG: alpha/beta hydrolase [Bacteroidetes bacterium B1(2017)]